MPETPIQEQPPIARDLGKVAKSLYLPREFLEDVVRLLKHRGQVVLYGPPGTGKTFVARALAHYVAEGRVDIVQFHPSYSYEDFVAGYRPVLVGDALTYRLTPGPLIRTAQAAANDSRPRVLLIDEINRGNLPKILGELLYLLEYRDEEIRLMYDEDDHGFRLPRNLWIIGTMNTADRSIGLIDAALRRRFHFVPLFPGRYPLENTLRDWLSQNRPEMRHVATIVDALNAKLIDRLGPHLQVGHSHFFRNDLSADVLEEIWRHDILPFLQDQLYGHEDELAEFNLSRFIEETGADTSADGMAGDDAASDG